MRKAPALPLIQTHRPRWAGPRACQAAVTVERRPLACSKVSRAVSSTSMGNLSVARRLCTTRTGEPIKASTV